MKKHLPETERSERILRYMKLLEHADTKKERAFTHSP